MLFYGCGVLAHPSTYYIGVGQDPAGYIWSLVWWPYALSHHLNPFISRVIWEPIGFNLAWAASIPAAGFAFWPITRWFGPIVSFNILMILTPAIVAWSAFLLCQHVSRAFYPSLVGGYLFGFSPYILGHMLAGHVNLALIFGVALCPYLVLRGVTWAVSLLRLSLLLATVLTLQFLISTEIVALITFFGAATLTIAYVVYPADQRAHLLKIVPYLIIAYLIFSFAVAPYLYYALSWGIPEQVHPIEKCSADFLGYFIPWPMLQFGGERFAAVTANLTPHMWYSEKGTYISPPMLLILGLYIYRHGRSPQGKLLIISSVLMVACSFGPTLHIADRSVMRFPWYWIARIPALNQALPIRFAIFFFLNLSIIGSIVFADPRLWKSIRVSLAALSIILLLPGRHYFTDIPHRVDTPSFFSREILETYVKPSQTLLIFPFGAKGTSMLWQASTDMYFRMVGGYISSYVPADYRRWAVVDMMLLDEPGPDFTDQLIPFLAYYHVDGIVIAPKAQLKWREPIERLGIVPTEVGGVLFYPIKPGPERQALE